MHRAGTRVAGFATTATTLALLAACSSPPAAPPAPAAPPSTPPPASSTEVKAWVHQFCAYTAPNAGYLPSLAAAGSVVGTPTSADRAAALRAESGTVRSLQSTETALADQLAGLPGGAHESQRALLERIERDLAASLGEAAGRIDAIPTGSSAGFAAASSAALRDATGRVRAAASRIVADRGIGPALTDDGACRSLS